MFVPCGSACAARCEVHGRVICCALLNIERESLDTGGFLCQQALSTTFNSVFNSSYVSHVSSVTNIIPTDFGAVPAVHSPSDVLINLFQISMGSQITGTLY